MRELQLAEAEDRLLDRAAVLQGWTKHMVTLRARLLAIVNRAAARTRAETPGDVLLGIVQEEILAAMNEIAGNGDATV